MCALCERPTPHLTEHHLIPRSQGRRRGLRAAELPTTLLCPACHKFLHRTYSNAQLGTELQSVDALRGQEDVRRFLAWVRRQPPGKGIRIR